MSDGFLIVYAINSKGSFDGKKDFSFNQKKCIKNKNIFIGVEDFFSMIKKIREDKVPVVTVGNKSDLEKERVVSYREGLDLAKSHDSPFFESGQKNFTLEYFYQLIREIRKHKYQKLFGEKQKKEKKNCSLF